jgi:hypothetical protein
MNSETQIVPPVSSLESSATHFCHKRDSNVFTEDSVANNKNLSPVHKHVMGETPKYSSAERGLFDVSECLSLHQLAK